jgi:hypothetical protein
MKKQAPHKLLLCRETIQLLESQTLRHAPGGKPLGSGNHTCDPCDTISCAPCN